MKTLSVPLFRSPRVGLAILLPLTLAGIADASIITGTGEGDLGPVKLFSERGGESGSFLAYGPNFSGGVRVAAGDVTGDGTPDIITSAGPGGGPHVRIFDGRTNVFFREFDPYGSEFKGGIFIAGGSLDGDSFADILVSPDQGGGPVKLFDGLTLRETASFFPYTPGFTGGVRVATGDVNNDGTDDIITAPGVGGGPHVKVINGRLVGNVLADGTISDDALIHDFEPFPGFTGGVFVSAGDVSGDGFDDIIVGAGEGGREGGGPHVLVFDGFTLALSAEFDAYNPNFLGGVRVATGDINGDGLSDIITAPGRDFAGGPLIKLIDGTALKRTLPDGTISDGALLASFTAYDGASNGAYVASSFVIPEPSSAVLLVVGAAGLAFRRTHRNTTKRREGIEDLESGRQ